MTDYLLQGDDEAARLMRQAAYLRPHTERALQAAGVGPGTRVLDLGAGMGDVALIAAELGASVVSVERDPAVAERARQRLGTRVEIVVGDVADPPVTGTFDVLCGRLILMYLRDPAAVLRELVARFVRPGGAVAAVEFDIRSALALGGPPLWHTTMETLCAIIRGAGFHDDLGLRLPRVFLAAGLAMPAVDTHVWTGVRADDVAHDMLTSTLRSVSAVGEKLGIARVAELDLPTLPQRLRDATADGHVAIGPLVVSAVARRA